jgi:rRNA biogenesis protein RRP5
MRSKKRSLDDAVSPKAKKSKVAEGSTDKRDKKKAKEKVDKPLQTSNLVPEEIDFPRGGGTTYTPQQVNAIRAEAIKEADELFKVRMHWNYLCAIPHATVALKENTQKTKRLRRKSDAKHKGKALDEGGKKANTIRIEHLNYKVCPVTRIARAHI